MHITVALHYKLHYSSVADPGFPVGGGVDLVGGTLTSEAGMFQKFCMSKQKNLDPWGGGRAPGTSPSRSANAVALHCNARIASWNVCIICCNVCTTRCNVRISLRKHKNQLLSFSLIIK